MRGADVVGDNDGSQAITFSDHDKRKQDQFSEELQLQTDLFDDSHCIGTIRHGTDEQPGCVLLVTNGDAAEKTVDLGPGHGGATFRDYLGHCADDVTADDDGRIALFVPGGSVSVWVRADAL